MEKKLTWPRFGFLQRAVW